MQAIKFVVRRGAGDYEHGLVLDQVDTGQISLVSDEIMARGVPQGVSLHLARHQLTEYAREGDTLWITLADGRSIEIENFFAFDTALQNRLFISSNGQISEVNFEAGPEGTLLVQYQGKEGWGKWNPSDEFLFYDEPEPMGLANGPGGYEDETVSMLGAGLALGPAMLSGAAVPAAAAAGSAAVLSALTASQSSTDPVETTAPVVATVETGDVPDTNSVSVSIATNLVETDGIISAGELADGSFTVTGQTDPEASVLVTIGDTSLPAEVSSDGTWSVVFPRTVAPAGEHSLEVKAQATDSHGNTTDANGTILVDTVVNRLTVTENITGGDNIANVAELKGGLPLSGNVEPGSKLSVRFDDKTYAASVAEDGAWSVTIPQQDIPKGKYTTKYTVEATDAAGNSETLTDSIKIDQSTPDAPKVETHEYDFKNKTTQKVSFSQTAQELSVDQVSSDGSAQSLQTTSLNDTGKSRTYLDFQTPVPDGSTLVVTAKVSVGNTNSTLMFLDVGTTSSQNLSGYDLDAYEITVIDLQSAKDTEVTLTEEQILGLSTVSNTITVRGHDDDSLVLKGATKGETVTDNNGDSFTLYTLGDEARIFADEDLTIST